MPIINNRKAFHEYSIEDRYEAGMILEGWEIKAIRAGRSNIKESYVVIKNGVPQIIGMHITPLVQASTHHHADPTRTRVLLLNKAEIAKLERAVERAGYTIMPLNLHFKHGRVKLEIGLGKGKKLHDKRADAKEKDGQREAAQAMKRNL
jgi:SsrA-binding protein